MGGGGGSAAGGGGDDPVVCNACESADANACAEPVAVGSALPLDGEVDLPHEFNCEPDPDLYGSGFGWDDPDDF